MLAQRPAVQRCLANDVTRNTFMAISHKNRAKLIRDGRRYIWWVSEVVDSHWCGHILNVFSDDKRFAFGYPLGQRGDTLENSFLWVWGKEFPGLPDAGGCWIELKCPRWDDVQVTSSFVRRLVDWCMSDKPLIRIKPMWNGRASPLIFVSRCLLNGVTRQVPRRRWASTPTIQTGPDGLPVPRNLPG